MRICNNVIVIMNLTENNMQDVRSNSCNVKDE